MGELLETWTPYGVERAPGPAGEEDAGSSSLTERDDPVTEHLGHWIDRD